MKPFNLQDALAGKPVITRDGRKVTDVRHLPSAAEDERVVAVLDGRVYHYREDGDHCNVSDSPYDLFMASETKRGWGFMYRGATGKSFFCNCPYATQEEAETVGRCMHGDHFFGTFPVEWEE